MNLRRWGGAALVVLLVGAVLSGCTSVRYLAQSVHGHMHLLNQARPVSEWLSDQTTPETLRERLALSQRIRDFAVKSLHLPDNSSYRRYADLQRPAAVWNVVAAAPLSLKLKTWCFPVTGCVAYRGYFQRDDAMAAAKELREEGLEVSVYGVPAYSTLGKLPGDFFADPLLNTFIGYPEGELARLVFHELAHQVVFASGDTLFNESFATAVERIGGRRWLAEHASPSVREEYARYDARRQEFRALAMQARQDLQELFESQRPNDDKLKLKQARMAKLRADHQALKAGAWAGYTGYDAWFERANNASLGVMAVYNEWVPLFEQLFERSGGDFPRFYAEVRRIADMPQAARGEALARAAGVPPEEHRDTGALR